MTEPVDLSGAHAALDGLRRQLCHCGSRGECLGCRGVEMLRAQMEAVTAAASQPVLLQVAQEASLKDMGERFGEMAQRLMDDPELRRAAEEMQARVLSDPQARRLLEELMHQLGAPPESGPSSGPDGSP